MRQALRSLSLPCVMWSQYHEPLLDKRSPAALGRFRGTDDKENEVPRVLSDATSLTFSGAVV